MVNAAEHMSKLQRRRRRWRRGRRRRKTFSTTSSSTFEESRFCFGRDDTVSVPLRGGPPELLLRHRKLHPPSSSSPLLLLCCCQSYIFFSSFVAKVRTFLQLTSDQMMGMGSTAYSSATPQREGEGDPYRSIQRVAPRG